MDAALKIRVGSTNPVKVEAVKEYFSDADVDDEQSVVKEMLHLESESRVALCHCPNRF